jgi:hypothetical protein
MQKYGEQTLHVAVVYGMNDVRYVTAAASRAALAARQPNSDASTTCSST